MRKEAAHWTLEDLIDFEHEVASATELVTSAQTAALTASRGVEGAVARRAGLHAWLNEIRKDSPGRRFSTGLGLIGTALCIFTFLSGSSAVLGLLDHEKGGINVILFLAILLGVQWLILLAALLGWAFRNKAAEGFSTFQVGLGSLARKMAGRDSHHWWRGLMDGGTQPRAAILWRLARYAQGAGIFFNLGILGGLLVLVMVRHVGFFWETTTEEVMRTTLEKIVEILSIPWSGWWPAATPGPEIIRASRWLPGHSLYLAPGPAAWWEFLLASTACWGLLPRVILWLLAWHGENSALRKMDFQGRHHRVLWRELTGTTRTENDTIPTDGILVLDVGGSGLRPDALRPFLLRHLRVNPIAWKNVAVLDEQEETEAAAALAKAPAGVVLLAEGWSLSPPRMADLHRKIRSTAGPATSIKFLAVNVSGDGTPSAVTDEERKQWEHFVDSLRDPLAEIHFYMADI